MRNVDRVAIPDNSAKVMGNGPSGFYVQRRTVRDRDKYRQAAQGLTDITEARKNYQETWEM